jgi:hypothetical protein
MSPRSGTSQPAPVYWRMSRTVTVKPVGAFRSDGSCDADRELVEADLVVALDRLLRRREEDDALGAVHALADRLDLGVDRLVELVDRLEVGRSLGRRDDGLRERRCALATALEGFVQLGGHRAALESEALDCVHLFVGIAREAVDRHDGV